MPKKVNKRGVIYKDDFFSDNNSKNLINALFKNSTDAIFYVTLSLKIVKVGKAIKTISGYDVSEFEGKSILSIPFIPKKSKLKILKEVKNAILKKKKTVSYEFEYIKKNKQVGYVRITTDYVFSGKKLIGFIAILREITAEKSEKKQLKYNYELFKNLYENAPIPYQSLDLKGNILDVNKSWLSNLGYTKNFVIGKNFSYFLESNLKKNFKKHFALFKKQNHTKNVRLNLVKKNGSLINVVFDGVWIKDDNGNLIRTQSVFRNVTDLIIAQEKLKKEEIKTKKLLDYADTIIVYLDEKNNIQFLNKTGAKLLEVNPEKIIGKNWMKEFIPKKEQIKIQKVFQELVFQKSKKFIHFKNYVKTKKDKLLLIKWRNSILYDDEQKIIGVISYGTDITKTSEIEKRQQQLLTAVEQASETVVITDLDGTIQYVNPYFKKTTGYSFKEAIGQNPRILKSGKQPKSYYKELWDTISSGKTWVGEFINVRKNKKEYVEKATISPIFDKNKNITGYIALKVDITDQKKQDDTFQKQMKELEDFQDVVVDRELKMVEIEKEIEKLKKENERLKKKLIK